MNRVILSELLKEQHLHFTKHIESLSEVQFMYSYDGKWTAGQQIKHLNLCSIALLNVFSLKKKQIEQNYGLSDRKSASIGRLLYDFKKKLSAGGKSPLQFEPEQILYDEKRNQIDTLLKTINDLCSAIENYSEQELDKYQMPHPLLGNINFREIIINAIHHVAHHEETNKLHLTTLKI